MRIRDSVFGSHPERRLYKALESAWPDKLVIYPNLPFLNVIDRSGARLTKVEWEFLEKTSLDYTVCEKGTYRPLLSVEFDGMGHGYSRGARYIEVVPAGDQYRREKLELKLRLARQVDYPLFVVSYDEAASITEDDSLTITHSIIGRCLVSQHMTQALEERVQDLNVEALPESVRNEMLQHLVIDTEVELEFDWDPLVVAAGRADREAMRTGLYRGDMRKEYLEEPPLPGDLAGRIAAWQHIQKWGCRATIDHPEGPITREAWVRNIEGVGVSTLDIADDLSEYLVLKAFLERTRTPGYADETLRRGPQK